MKITFRIGILIFFVLLSLISIFSIPPKFLETGVIVDSVESHSKIFEEGLRSGMVIKSIDGKVVNSLEDYSNAMSGFANLRGNETRKLIIQTEELEIVNLLNKSVLNDISVSKISPTRIKTGLDLRGGARAFVKPDVQLTETELNDLISISEQRLNIYGLSDIKLFKVLTSAGETLMGIEIAGSSPEDLEELIAKQGKFEAKIGNETVFVGGDKDITHVGRTGQDAFVSECFQVQEGTACNFQFVIFLSEEAAQRHADITREIPLNGSYLSKQLDLFIDDELVSSLNIGSSLKGTVATQIQISGSGIGRDNQEAIATAKQEMKKLQTVLITGSLPVKLQIVKIDKISPNLGEKFTKQLVIAGLAAIVTVAITVFIRYRKIKLPLFLILISISEVVIILGVAALIKWNLDLPSIAGILATIGTGVDAQLIILDESKNKKESLRNRIKKALFVIFTAFSITFASLIPLTGFLSFMGIGAASAGLLKGFAVTTLIGITAGILLARPAFADIVRQMEDKDAA